MSTKAVRTNHPTSDASVARVDMKFEAVVIPVSDVDRAKEFCMVREQAGEELPQ